ncbi:hypothetical protein GCM10011386_30440 [Parapedobacter defluvii]|uniref:DUF5672 domain-containing protein n=1 Tax=Parapedobacter defluvii TaxID=2045106 RepID=A0ABQ1M7E3_9SPHI|nr:DUF5672 family protein [Parapedobacter defluvii]GGC36217.1 hypothetical protein GCM10011386_30440 [Parapedobacter defluvii]
MLQLKDVTLVGVDCVNIERLILAAEISQKEINFGAIKLLSSIRCNSPYIIPIEPLKTVEQYSEFMIKKLYQYIDTPFALVIQWDGFVLNPKGWRNQFLSYDYIGAPWNDKCVGNGGFSLRSRSLLKALSEDNTISQFHPEDFIICRVHRQHLEKQGFLFADDETALKFSIESRPWDGQFGFHQTDISKSDFLSLLDKEWYSLMIESYINIHQCKINLQGQRNY